MAVYTKITEQEIGYLFHEYNGIEKIEGIGKKYFSNKINEN